MLNLDKGFKRSPFYIFITTIDSLERQARFGGYFWRKWKQILADTIWMWNKYDNVLYRAVF